MKSAFWLWIILLVSIWVAHDFGFFNKLQHPSRHQESTQSALTSYEATRRIQEIGRGQHTIIYTAHAKKRMRKRRISFSDVAETLMRGEVWEDARLGDEGEWLYKMNYQPTDGTRRIEVVVAIEKEKLVVISAMRQGGG